MSLIQLILWVIRYKPRYAVLSFCVLIFSGLTAFGNLAHIHWMRYLLDFTLWAKSPDAYKHFMLIAIGMPATLLLTSIFGVIEGFLRTRTQQAMARSLRLDLFKGIQICSPLQFHKYNTATLSSRFNNDLKTLEQLLMSFSELIYAFIYVVGALATAIMLQAKLALIMLPCVLVATMTFWWVGARSKYFARSLSQKNALMQQTLLESIFGARVIRIFQGEDKEVFRFSGINSDIYHLSLKRALLTQYSDLLFTFVMVLVKGVVIYYYGINILKGGYLSVGSLVAFLYVIDSVTGPFYRIQNTWAELQKSVGLSQGVLELINLIPAVQDRGKDHISHEIESLEFRDVSFSYEKAAVLEKVSFQLKKGDRLAVIGKSGIGKTTLINLIPRFFDPSSGAIFLNGIDIRDIKLKSLRSVISMVPQETFLFNDTLANNIKYGCPEASEEELQEAMKISQVDKIVLQLSHGLDSIVGESGSMLSTGQKQRISICRALLKKAPILILDEPTSSVDSVSEKEILEILMQVSHAKLIILVTHRLDSLAYFNQVMSLDRTYADKATF